MFLLEKVDQGLRVMMSTGVLTQGTLCGEPTEHLEPSVSDLEPGGRCVCIFSGKQTAGSLIQRAPSQDPGRRASRMFWRAVARSPTAETLPSGFESEAGRTERHLGTTSWKHQRQGGAPKRRLE